MKGVFDNRNVTVRQEIDLLTHLALRDLGRSLAMQIWGDGAATRETWFERIPFPEMVPFPLLAKVQTWIAEGQARVSLAIGALRGDDVRIDWDEY